jgi:hypothetical protein
MSVCGPPSAWGVASGAWNFGWVVMVLILSVI